jgi:hypothetical protein
MSGTFISKVSAIAAEFARYMNLGPFDLLFVGLEIALFLGLKIRKDCPTSLILI